MALECERAQTSKGSLAFTSQATNSISADRRDIAMEWMKEVRLIC